MANERTKARNRGKALERRVARALGTSRHLRKGEAEPDLIFGITDNFIGECKHRQSIALHRWAEQCRKYANTNRNPSAGEACKDKVEPKAGTP